MLRRFVRTFRARGVVRALPSSLPAELVVLAVVAFAEHAEAAGDEHVSGEMPGATTSSAPSTPHSPVEATVESEAIDYCTHRYEPAGFPLIGGDSDIGFEFGVAGTLSNFGDCYAPYKWNMDLVLALSVKSGPNGAEVAQQDYGFNWDIPGAFGGAVRLNPNLLFQRTINEGYYGLGNATTDNRPSTVNGVPGRYFQFVAQELRVRELTRFVGKSGSHWNPVLTTMYRYEAPETYGGSKLEADAKAKNADGTPLIRGVEPMSVVTLGGGEIYDTRDNEFLPHRGQFHQMGLKLHEALPFSDNIRYAQLGASFAGYVPLTHSLTFAARALGDALFGNVPFYEMYSGGPFVTNEIIGGGQGVRGVPIGRYAGPLKILGNAEIRAMVAHFKVVGQEFHIGTSTFFDTGRVWSDYTFSNPHDGRGLGFKWGVGVGAVIQWGQAAVFRIEAAYSPDAVAENPGFPIGLYVADGVMF